MAKRTPKVFIVTEQELAVFNLSKQVEILDWLASEAYQNPHYSIQILLDEARSKIQESAQQWGYDSEPEPDVPSNLALEHPHLDPEPSNEDDAFAVVEDQPVFEEELETDEPLIEDVVIEEPEIETPLPESDFDDHDDFAFPETESEDSTFELIEEEEVDDDDPDAEAGYDPNAPVVEEDVNVEVDLDEDTDVEEEAIVENTEVEEAELDEEDSDTDDNTAEDEYVILEPNSDSLTFPDPESFIHEDAKVEGTEDPDVYVVPEVEPVEEVEEVKEVKEEKEVLPKKRITFHGLFGEAAQLDK
jgi:hypothetical protein